MTGVVQLMLASGGAGLAAAITGWAVKASGGSTSSRGCYLSFMPDGTITYTITAGTDSTTKGSPTWFSQVAAGIGANYWIRANVVSGPSMSVGTVNTWLSLASAQNFGHANGVTDQTANPLVLTFDFAPAASGTPILLTSSGLSIARTSP